MQEQISDVMINRIDRKLERLQMCNQFWQIDRYDKLKIKDFIRTNLCRDKFCNNCKKVKQAERMAKFMPEINKYRDSKMSQIVLTVPNCSGDDLHDTIQKMFKAFARLIEYFKGKKKIKAWISHGSAIKVL